MIPIRNIYYMLSYAFQILQEKGYRDIATEQFDNAAELCAAILEKGVSIQLKRGLGREYIEQTEALSTLRGKIDISESIKTQSIQKKQLICTFDEFSENSYLNRIIKTTFEVLIRLDISKDRKKALKKLLVFFGNVETLDPYSINWKIQYNRNNQTYRMLISICYLVIKGLLQTQTDGSTRLMEFGDNHMHQLYEEFIRKYYEKECSQVVTERSLIPWALDDGYDEMLPDMRTDVTLTKGNNVLIIDAKYYGCNTQEQFGIHKNISSNLYQIFTYVKNKDSAFGETPHKVSGMLLYARTDDAFQPDNTYQMSGNKISVRTLDLNREFSEIKAQLNRIIDEHFSQ